MPGWMKVIVIGAIALGVHHHYNSTVKAERRSAELQTAFAQKISADNDVVMYSATWCGYCKALSKKMHEAGIPFTEHYVDIDKAREAEFFQILARSGPSAETAGIPGVIVNDSPLMYNPGIDRIKSYLKLKG